MLERLKMIQNCVRGSAPIWLGVVSAIFSCDVAAGRSIPCPELGEVSRATAVFEVSYPGRAGTKRRFFGLAQNDSREGEAHRYYRLD